DLLVPERPDAEADDERDRGQDDPAVPQGRADDGRDHEPLFSPDGMAVSGAGPFGPRTACTMNGFRRVAPLPSPWSPALPPPRLSTRAPWPSPTRTSVTFQVPGPVPTSR